jgi:hypothetical protein
MAPSRHASGRPLHRRYADRPSRRVYEGDERDEGKEGDVVVSRDASGSYEYYHSDGLGSTRQLSNDNQFGNIESSAGSSNNVYEYVGQWGYRNDGDDGLMPVGARDYDPESATLISRGRDSIADSRN